MRKYSINDFSYAMLHVVIFKGTKSKASGLQKIYDGHLSVIYVNTWKIQFRRPKKKKNHYFCSLFLKANANTEMRYFMEDIN